jgi:predicted transcriptional regulator
MKDRIFIRKSLTARNEWSYNSETVLSPRRQTNHSWGITTLRARRFGVKVHTVALVLRRWRINGYQTSYLDRRKYYLNRRISEDIVRELVHPKLLRKMSHLSFRMWVSVIRQSFSMTKFTHSTFRKSISAIMSSSEGPYTNTLQNMRSPLSWLRSTNSFLERLPAGSSITDTSST